MGNTRVCTSQLVWILRAKETYNTKCCFHICFWTISVQINRYAYRF